MNVKTLTQFITLTIVLSVGLGAVVGAALRVNIAANWEEQRCDPYVIPIAGFFKPSTDPRTASQFATDNWSFCSKEYIQDALRLAASVPQDIANAEAATVGLTQDIASTAADVFFDLWNFCYETYSTFMDQMKGAAKLFHNFMINLYSITERLNAAALSIIYGLIALIVTTVNAVQVVIIVAIIVVGIIIALQIILFFILLPISGMIIMISALVSVVVVAVATAIAAATVSELFSPGACFAKGTPIQLADGTTRPIESIQMGNMLDGGARVSATHHFWSTDKLFDLHGVKVTGDHLIAHPTESTRLIPVREHPDAIVQPSSFWAMLQGGRELWCLTTTTRQIPCVGRTGKVVFADWEEIADDDASALECWYRKVWVHLNWIEAPPPSSRFLASEAGISPDSLVACRDWTGKRILKPMKDVRIGDLVFDGPISTTLVVGKVRLAGDQATDAVELPSPESKNIVTRGTWVWQYDLWQPIMAVGKISEVHPIWWEHLYTESGSFYLSGGWHVRDASDVGLSGLRPLVEAVVLPPR